MWILKLRPLQEGVVALHLSTQALELEVRIPAMAPGPAAVREPCDPKASRLHDYFNGQCHHLKSLIIFKIRCVGVSVCLFVCLLPGKLCSSSYLPLTG